jgi:ribonuclease HI
MASFTLFTDGGARGNPGPAGIGVSVLDDQDVEVYSYGEAIGIATNNEAEYQAFLHALSWLKQQPLQPKDLVVFKLDSLLVVEQLNKRWKVKEERMKVYTQQAWADLSQLPCAFTIAHIPRAQNKRADQLVNQALDAA